MAFAPDSAAIKWTVPSLFQVPAVGPNGTLYAIAGISTVGTLGATTLSAINPAGSMLWSFALPSMALSGSYTPAVDSNGVIYVGSGSALTAVNASGLQKWSFPTGSFTTTSPAIGRFGTVFIGAFDGKLYAVHGDSDGLAASSWPMLNGDARHTGQAKPTLPLVFANPANCLFNWAEFRYPHLFFRSTYESFSTTPPYYYRYYYGTQAYLGTATDGHVYYLGPESGGAILDVGLLSDWLVTAGCAASR